MSAYSLNAEIFWRALHRMDPDQKTFIGAFPEDDPQIYIYEFACGPESSYICVQEMPNQLLTREVTETAEIEAIQAHGTLEGLEQQADPNLPDADASI